MYHAFSERAIETLKTITEALAACEIAPMYANWLVQDVVLVDMRVDPREKPKAGRDGFKRDCVRAVITAAVDTTLCFNAQLELPENGSFRIQGTRFTEGPGNHYPQPEERYEHLTSNPLVRDHLRISIANLSGPHPAATHPLDRAIMLHLHHGRQLFPWVLKPVEKYLVLKTLGVSVRLDFDALAA